ncbi:MAG: tyrosine-type recombinase/integrase [Carboxydocellales bacterium]
MKAVKRSDGRWQVALELPKGADGKRNRKFIIGNTRKECLEKLADAQSKLNMGYNFKSENLTVENYLLNWLEVYCARKERSTVSGYRQYIVNHIIPELGAIKMTKLLPLHLQNFYNNERSKGYKGKTILQEHRILRKALKDAVGNNLLPYNPVDRVEAPKEEKFKNNIPTPEELSIMLAAAAGTVHELPIILAGVLGLRRSEVFGLKWGSVDFKTGVLTVKEAVVPVDRVLDIKRPKNDTSFREIVIPEKVMLVFNKRRGLPATHVCLNEKGKPQSVKSYNGRFTNFLKRHNIPHFRFHDLRHYNATLMLWLEIDPKIASKNLGHSTPAIFQKTYQHVTWGMNRQVAERINRTL